MRSEAKVITMSELSKYLCDALLDHCPNPNSMLAELLGLFHKLFALLVLRPCSHKLGQAGSFL
jgi:hypothetical protein